MHRSTVGIISLISLFALIFCGVSARAERIQLGGTSLEFNIPSKISAYESVPINCRISGKGEVTIQAVADDSDKYARLF